MSRSDLARELGLTRTTVGNAIKLLLEADLVHEPVIVSDLALASDPARIGRPSVGVSLNAAGAYFVGLDVSTSALTAVLIDFTMTVVARFTTPVGPDLQDVSIATERLAALAKRAIRAAGKHRDRVRGIGVSIPGLVARDGRVAIAPFLEWRAVDLKTSLEQQLGSDIGITICNDAVALASVVCAAAPEAEMSDLLLILLSEGIGSAMIRQGRVSDGFNGYAGEIGQMVLGPRAGPAPSDTFQLLAGQRYFKPFFDKGVSVADAVVALAARTADPPGFGQALDRWAEHLAAGLLNAIWLLDPERIVIGGVLAPLYPHVAARVNEILGESMRGLRVPPIRLSEYGADGPARGAAALIRETLFALPILSEGATD